MAHHFDSNRDDAMPKLPSMIRSTVSCAALLAACLGSAQAQPAARHILFIGNSFTFAANSAVRFYRNGTVTDLNREGIGGVPALFKSFTDAAGLRYEVAVETHPGIGLDWHLAHRADAIGARPYDDVVMHGFSLLDADKPGDATLLVSTTRTMTTLLRKSNADVHVWLTATWARPDKLFPENTPWHGKTLETMATDLRAGYDQAARADQDVAGVIPVGEAFTRAIRTGVADANPYDGTDAGKVDLWSFDNYHASVYGYYIEALMVFGKVTGRDPRSLGEQECSALELGLSMRQAAALQQVAFDELAANGKIEPLAPKPSVAGGAPRCPDVR
jgi:hypothetical protein